MQHFSTNDWYYIQKVNREVGSRSTQLKTESLRYLLSPKLLQPNSKAVKLVLKSLHKAVYILLTSKNQMENNSENTMLSSLETSDSLYEFLDNRAAEMEKGFNGHTMRRNVTAPSWGRTRSCNGGGKVRDNYHYPTTRTWRCKGFQHKSNRQCLKRARKYEKHCE